MGLAWGAGVVEAARMYLPDRAAAYGVVREPATKTAACALAARLGVSLNPKDYPEAPETMQDPNEYNIGGPEGFNLSYQSDGNFYAFWLDRSPQPEASVESVVGAVPEEETTAAAESFLAKTALLPDGCRLVEVRGGESRGYTFPGESTQRPVLLSRKVVYSRFLDGISDGEFTVMVNGRGEIYSVNRCMRELALVGRYPLLSPEEALAVAQSDEGRIAGPHSANHQYRGEVESVELRYFEGGTGWRLDTVQPIYWFQGTAYDENGRGEPFLAMAPAVRPEYLAPVTLPVPGGSGRPAAGGPSGPQGAAR